MYLLYLDDSGSVNNKNEEYLVLAGLIVPERGLYWINQKMDDLARQYSPDNPDLIEFHASEIFHTKEENSPWKHMSIEEKIKTLKSVLNTLKYQCQRSEARILACAVKKSEYPTEDPMKMAFEDLCSRFDKFINRRHRENDDNREKGLIILDKSSYETSLQKLAKNFRKNGTQWNTTTSSLQEVPLFVDSKASRAIQLADHAAYAVYRHYEKQDLQYFNIIQSCFDCDGARIFGLAHKTRDRDCRCLACMSKMWVRDQE